MDIKKSPRKSQLEILENRKQTLLQRQHLLKDKNELKKIEKQLKEIESMIERYIRSERTTQRRKKGG